MWDLAGEGVCLQEGASGSCSVSPHGSLCGDAGDCGKGAQTPEWLLKERGSAPWKRGLTQLKDGALLPFGLVNSFSFHCKVFTCFCFCRYVISQSMDKKDLLLQRGDQETCLTVKGS